MSEKSSSPIIWLSDLQWLSHVNLKSTVSMLSLWQSVVYVMKKNEIALDEAGVLEHRLTEIEGELLAAYIEEATDSSDTLHHATPKKRKGPGIKPKSAKEVPPAIESEDSEVIVIQDIADIAKIVDENEKYLSELLIDSDHVEHWLARLTEERQETLAGLPIATSVHAFIAAEVDKGDASLLDVERTKSLGGNGSSLLTVTKVSLNAWPMLKAFKMLADPAGYEKKLVQETTKNAKGAIDAMLLYVIEDSQKHRKPDGKIDIYQVAKSLFRKCDDHGQWVPPVATLKYQLSQFVEKL